MDTTQRDREVAAAKIKGDSDKAVAVRAKILAGELDSHPAVQAATFYRSTKPCP